MESNNIGIENNEKKTLIKLLIKLHDKTTNELIKRLANGLYRLIIDISARKEAE